MSGLALTPRDACLDIDLGLPLPNVDAVASHSGVPLAEGQQYLLGQVLTPMRALSPLQHAVQAERSIAAQYLYALAAVTAGAPHARISIRATAPLQFRAAAKLRDQLSESGVSA